MQTECINELLEMDEATGKWVMKPDKPWFKEAQKRFQIPIFMDVFFHVPSGTLFKTQRTFQRDFRYSGTPSETT